MVMDLRDLFDSLAPSLQETLRLERLVRRGTATLEQKRHFLEGVLAHWPSVSPARQYPELWKEIMQDERTIPG